MTVEELLARITSWEITEHAAYLELEQAEMDKAKGSGPGKADPVADRQLIGDAITRARKEQGLE
jgi:hypothetical protein